MEVVSISQQQVSAAYFLCSDVNLSFIKNYQIILCNIISFMSMFNFLIAYFDKLNDFITISNDSAKEFAGI